MNDKETATSFEKLSLAKPILAAIRDIGYETPSPIQAKTIPEILAGKDILAQAQTGTGKTAAFALPLLSRIDLKKKSPQVLVLAPTRELAIQVSEAFQKYASHLPKFFVLPVYGGQDYRNQLKNLKRGVHVVVGTPGRVMDHMRRGTLALNELRCLVLDEADEMLKMGFVDDVEWILEQTPNQHQIALFSATLPKEIRRIAQKHLVDPKEIYVEVKTTTAATIDQQYLVVSPSKKLDALTRILEASIFEGVIVFVRTKTATVELTDKLKARGLAASAINGDLDQKAREKAIEQLRKGSLDILVATDVAARGLDVERITHVINYDAPYGTESYVHRIGRTGRAGKTGTAILFITPREQRMLRAIEQATKQKIAALELPSAELISNRRVADFKQRLSTLLLEEQDLSEYVDVVEQFCAEQGHKLLDIAAALAKLAQGDTPLFPKEKPERKELRKAQSQAERSAKKGKSNFRREMESYRIEVGKVHGASAGSILGAIANEGGLEGHDIGKIKIFNTHSTVDLSSDLPKEIIKTLRKVWVAEQQLNISKIEAKNNNRTFDESFRGRSKKAQFNNTPNKKTKSDKRKPRKKDKLKKARA